MSQAAPPPAAARPFAFWLMIGLLVLSIGMFITAIFVPVPGRSTQQGTTTSLGLPVPAFDLTERNGQHVTNTDLLGKVWVASFVFTRCTGPCPSVTATVARLQSELDLANQPDVRLVTFTVDPDRDTPDELKKYAEHFRAHPDRWLFLTGPEETMHKIAKDGFKIAAERTKTANPPVGQEFDHSTYLVVVDKTGQIRGHFNGYRGKHDEDGKQFDESFARLKETVRGLLKE